MARIPNDELERLKTDVNLLDLVRRSGYRPQKQGKDYAISCPFHDDDTPSLIITPKSNLFNCFGCGAAGTVVDWVMKTQGVSFRRSVEILRNDLGLITPVDTPRKQSTTKQISSPLAADSDGQTLLNQVIDYYHQTLKQSPEALAYLESRGLGDATLIDHFKLGYANRTLAYRLPQKQYKAGKELRGQLQEIGILRQSGHEHLNGSIVVPVFDAENNVVEAYGRKVLGKRLRKGTPQHLYLPGEHRGVWNAAGLVGQKNIILCEALIDAMTFWVHGFTNVTASYGTQGFTDDHLQLFKQIKVDQVYIAYDRDEAGNTAAEKLAEQLHKHGIDCYRVNFPKGMDANQYALEVQPAKKSLDVVVRSAEWIGRGCAPANPVVESEPIKTEEKAAEEEKLTTQQPQTPKTEIPTETNDQEMKITLGDRTYRIRGLDKNTQRDALKVNLLVSNDSGLHVDTFDLYSARHRQQFIKLAADELGVELDAIKKDLGKVLLKLEELQEQQLEKDQLPEDHTPLMKDADKEKALALLNDKNLLARILEDFTHCGVVGEETNKLVGYLAAVSRKSDKPLAVLIQSTSAAGKSSLMDAVLNLVPVEEKVQYSAMTGQSLFYMGQTNLKHKILAIAEEEGASNASYALKLLQSEGEITIASTGKDDSTGDLVTKEYTVEGPVMLFLTTTAIDIDEELLNRCLVLTVDEDREQTEAIHQQQRFAETLEGLLASQTKNDLIQLHQNAQRLLKPLKVVNPYANQLTFLSDKTRTRRDHQKYLMLIRAIALLHQYQREIKTVEHNGQPLDYIEVTLADIKTANKLAHEVLGRTLDELPPQTRKLLKLITLMVEKQCQALSMVMKDYRFSRKQIREATGWGNTQLKLHCHRLEELEYLLVHRGGRGQSFEYELLYDGNPDDEQAHLMGLVDPENPKNNDYDEKKSGLNADKSGSSRPQVGAKPGCSRTVKNAASPAIAGLNDESLATLQKKGITAVGVDASHPSRTLAAELV